MRRGARVTEVIESAQNSGQEKMVPMWLCIGGSVILVLLQLLMVVVGVKVKLLRDDVVANEDAVHAVVDKGDVVHLELCNSPRSPDS